MQPSIWFIFLGLIVGTLVGLTGLGGGALMTPLLILSGLPVVVAIATDIVYAAITKSFASLLHIKEKNVDFKVVGILLAGSIPGLLAGYFFAQIILDNFGEAGLNLILTVILSVLLISLSTISIINEVYKLIVDVISDTPDEVSEEFARMLEKETREKSLENLFINKQTYSIIMAAFAVGLLVHLTSVGSGVLITILLLGVLPAKKVVGTELVHASILVTISAVLYTSGGFVEYSVLWKIVLGSFFGVLIGIRFAKNIPREKFKIILLSVILLAGIIVLSQGLH